MNNRDVVVSATLSALGSATSYLSCSVGDRIRIVTSGTFSAVITLEYSDSQPAAAFRSVAGITSGTTDIIIGSPGFYRLRFTAYTSGTASVSMRAYDPTIILDADGKWDDIRSPATGINPTGPASPPGVDADDGGLLFDAASTEVCSVYVQMPHAWKQGSVIVPHVHWSKTTSASGNVYWRLEYKIANVDGTFPGSWTTANVTATSPVISDTNTADKHLVSDFGEIDMTGYTASCMLKCRVSRIGGDALDTYGADAKLLEFDVHYLVDSLGSGGEFIK